MGHHYIPQRYLEGFADPQHPTRIWQFDKKLGLFSGASASIKKIAQERDFYPPDTETQLNKKVELPANNVIEKLRNGASLTDSDRIPLAIYMATMMYRVPAKRQRAYDSLPEVLSGTIDRYKRIVDAALNKNEINDLTAAMRIAEADSLYLRFAEDPPEEAIEQIRTPWPSRELTQILLNMNWYLIRSTGPSYFVTSDNPMFTFDCWGVTHRHSEFTFPLARDLALFGTWQSVKKRSNPDTAQNLVKEANRRIISAAHRFIFSHQPAEWIPVVAGNPEPYLSRIAGTRKRKF